MPYQPEGIWASPYDGNKWKISEGEDKYRRSIYTYYKRSSPYPSQLTFDGTGRNVCNARRIRTNTPLQALVTLNDPVFMEAATHFGQKMLKNPGLSVNDRIQQGYHILINKPISPSLLQPLVLPATICLPQALHVPVPEHPVPPAVCLCGERRS